MRAELVFLGRRVNMASQRRRRTLVVAVYAGFLALFMASWRFDQWLETGIGLFVYIQLVGMYLLGGRSIQGLVRPFSRPQMRWQRMTARLTRWTLERPAPENVLQNDEREQAQNSRAHYIAYQILGIFCTVLWIIQFWKMDQSKMLLLLRPFTGDQFLYGGLLLSLCLYMTLPQAILLWSEPDMEE
jgi:hypothetical protein